MNRASAVIQLQGRLRRDAECRQMRLDTEGHMVPALCMEVESPDTGSICHVEQYFPAGHDDQCRAAAHRLKKGLVVSFHVDTGQMHYKACGVSSIHVLTPEDTAAEAEAATEAHAEAAHP